MVYSCALRGFYLWVSKLDQVMVSEIERTIIDCLNHPQHCGGIPEIAKGIWIRRHEINWERLLEYAHRLNKKVVFHRLGFLLELYDLATKKFRNKLRRELSSSFPLLDTQMPKNGPYQSSWHLQVNIPTEELEQIRFT